ncbi:hypothetical protein PHBOTO_004278 [Pseudozyma hubeiensis]|nr:hypothetical protein PHBOTO_004278 [Pseudozyma hubeiensis]
MNTRTSQAEMAIDDEEMPRSSAASRVSLANLLGPSGPGSSPYANSPRTSPRKRSSADASGSNLHLPSEAANASNGTDHREPRRSNASSPQRASAAAAEAEQPFHDAEENVQEDVAMVDASEENDQNLNGPGHDDGDDDDDDDDEEDDDDDDDKATTDAGSASEEEGGDKGEGPSSKDGAKSGDKAAAPKKRSRRRSPSLPEAVAPAPKRPTVRINILEARQSGYLINIPELVLVKLKEEDHPWAKWYEEQLLVPAEPEPVVAPPGGAGIPGDLEPGLAKLLAKYRPDEPSGAPSGAGAASKKRRRPIDDKYDIGQYDVRDPFVDDSELNIDEPTHFAKPKADGFYVTQGTVELAKAKAMAKGQPLPPSERPKPLSIRDSKFGFAGSLNRLVARKAQQGAALPPMPPTGSPSMQLGSLLNSGDPGSPSVGAASALTNTSRQEGTRDSPIKVDDNDSGSSKMGKKTNRYPTLPVDPRLQASFDELKAKVDAESFAVKTKFPPSLKPPLVETAKLAVMLGEYDDNFFNHLPTIFPYNRFTMMKLVKREFFPHHMKYFEDLKQDHLDKLGEMIRDSFPQQLAEFESAHKAWVDRGEAPKDSEAAQADKPPKEKAAADESMDVDGAKEVEDENIEPTKRWKWSEEMREEVFMLITIENAMSELRNEKYKLEGSVEQYSEINARKACYKQMFELFPEDGWTTSTNISREYAQIKKKKDRQEARGEDIFADSRASSAVPA